MESPAGLIQFQQLFISCCNLRLSLCQSHRARFPGGDDGIIETSGFSVSKGQGCDRISVVILG